jgi:hypothetical protein
MNTLKISTLLALATSSSVYAEPIDFVVKNSTDSQLIALQISSNNHSWSAFSSVKLEPGKTANFQWNPTPQSNCTQYVRGEFTKTGWSFPVKIDFCENPNLQVTFK